MKMVLSQIASNVELCKVAQQHPLFPHSVWCELLPDPLTKDERVPSACSAHGALPHTPLPFCTSSWEFQALRVQI